MSAEAAEAEAVRRWPMPHPQPVNANQRRENLVRSALRQGFVEGVRWREGVEARARVSGTCSECGEAIDPDAVGFEAGGYGMCGSCLHHAVRSGWEPGL